jgi:folate-dependent phosphoribosylglycinamide formyltransferase PurN
MKAVCLVGNYEPLLYFANQVHRRHPLELAVVEHGESPRPRRASALRRMVWKWQKHGLGRAIRDTIRSPVKAKRRSRLHPKGYRDDYERVFGERTISLDASIPRLDVASANDPEVRRRLAELRPDLLLVHGTDLIRNDVIETARLALNLHWGLSPYYRGSDCTEWALLNRDPYNVGVTVHKLTSAIDGGGILGQARPEITPEDTVHSINMKLTRIGTRIVLEAADRLAAGEPLEFHPQNPSAGFLSLSAHMTVELRGALNRWLRRGMLAKMLKRPSRKVRMPIVELLPSGEAEGRDAAEAAHRAPCGT